MVQYSLLDGQKVLIEINKHIVLGNFVMTGVLQQNTSCEYCSYVIYALLLDPLLSWFLTVGGDAQRRDL